MRNQKNWVNNAVIYQIVIDRFAGYDPTKDWKKPQFIGGNLTGIIDSLPYLKDLGVNAIWISPFYQTSAYHGYHITDFYKVDPHFGTKNDLKRLIDLIHQNDMCIIADFVPNHVSRFHPFFLDACTSKNSPYFNWFHFYKWPDDYLSFLSVKEIPKLNLNNNETKEYIINVAKYWLSFGLDGFRLDHVIGPSNSFWKKFSTEIKKSYPYSLLIGEAWMHGISWKELNTIQIPFKKLKWFRKQPLDRVLQNYVPLLDGVLDFTVQHYFQEYFCKENRSMNTMHKFKKNLTNHYLKFPPEFHLPIFLDNHDMDRFLFQCNNNTDQLKRAARVQFSLSQPIILYYGTEQRMIQTKSVWEIKNHGDLHVRMPMPWNNNNKDNELFYFYRNLIHKRLKK